MGLVPGGAGYVWTDIPAASFLRTTDGGSHWTNTLPIQSSPQFSVSVLSSGDGWAIAYPQTGAANASGTIYETGDGGARWHAEGTEPTLWTQPRTALDGSLWLLSGQVSGGYLHAAAYQGAGAPAALPGGRTIRELDPVDARAAVALAGGPSGTSLWRTADGGQTWSLVLAARTPTVAAPVAFWNATDGYGVDAQGGPGLLTTQDAGATWSVASSLSAMPNPQVDCFVSPKIGWAVDQKGEVWQTLDGGATWRHVSSPPAWTETPPPQVQSLSFVDQAHGFAIVGLNSSDLYATSDGGRTWNDVRPDVQAAAFATPDAGWVISDHVLYRTTDAGQHWTPIVEVPANFGWVGTPPQLSDVVWLWDGIDGEMAVSTDGGRTFETSQLPAARRGGVDGPPAISGPTTGLLVIDGGLWQTADAGAHWHRIAVLPSAH
ncbi:MAG: YCF48-related protein [Dehalococcoidales bacterium]|nr:YCF48-related protein [Dehalococcoidales bacterium]